MGCTCKYLNVNCRPHKILPLMWFEGENLRHLGQKDPSPRSVSDGRIWKNQGRSLQSKGGNHPGNPSKGPNQT